MKTVLITGAGPTGVTGRAIKESLLDSYNILLPSSKELDLTDDAAVSNYFDAHTIDFVVHCATCRNNISQTVHMVDEELESNLRMYFALAAQSEKFKKMVYFGSGAEYDKSRPIVNINEEQFGERIPPNRYGLGKYIMNQHCRNSKNIYNLRMFGTLNKYERYTKNVVCNLCAKAVMGLPLMLRRDCLFSWVDIRDVAKAIDYLFCNPVSRHDYNVALSQKYSLSEIASIINEVANLNTTTIAFERTGMNYDYTCETKCFQHDIPISMTNIRSSILDVFQYLFSIKDSIDTENIDNRWG